MKYLNNFNSHLSISLFALFFLVTLYILINQILKTKINDFSKRKSISVNLRNFLFLFFVILNFSLWAGEIKTVLLSTAAITAAVIITFKEFLLSFFASFFITSNQLFSIGDEIEYEAIKGKVLDKNFFGVKVQSFSATENKIVFIPNIVFLTAKVMNFSKVEYVKFNQLNISVQSINYLIEFKDVLDKKMEEIMYFNKKLYEDFKVEKVDYFDKIVPEKNYYFKFDLSEKERNQIQIFYFAKKDEKNKLEKMIIECYFNFLKEKENDNKRV